MSDEGEMGTGVAVLGKLKKSFLESWMVSLGQADVRVVVKNSRSK